VVMRCDRFALRRYSAFTRNEDAMSEESELNKSNFISQQETFYFYLTMKSTKFALVPNLITF